MAGSVGPAHPPFFSCAAGALHEPILYSQPSISRTHRQRYYELLQNVRDTPATGKHGSISSLEGVLETATEAIETGAAAPLLYSRLIARKS